jgi:hypothetical protein
VAYTNRTLKDTEGNRESEVQEEAQEAPLLCDDPPPQIRRRSRSIKHCWPEQQTEEKGAEEKEKNGSERGGGEEGGEGSGGGGNGAEWEIEQGKGGGERGEEQPVQLAALREEERTKKTRTCR